MTKVFDVLGFTITINRAFPKDFGVNGKDAWMRKSDRTVWHITAADFEENWIEAGSGVIQWRGSAQQFLRQFKKL